MNNVRDRPRESTDERLQWFFDPTEEVANLYSTQSRSYIRYTEIYFTLINATT